MDKNSTALESLILNKKDSINLKDCYSTAGIEEILTTLDQELIGLQDVKNRIREISSVLLFLLSFAKRIAQTVNFFGVIVLIATNHF